MAPWWDTLGVCNWVVKVTQSPRLKPKYFCDILLMNWDHLGLTQQGQRPEIWVTLPSSTFRVARKLMGRTVHNGLIVLEPQTNTFETHLTNSSHLVGHKFHHIVLIEANPYSIIGPWWCESPVAHSLILKFNQRKDQNLYNHATAVCGHQRCDASDWVVLKVNSFE